MSLGYFFIEVCYERLLQKANQNNFTVYFAWSMLTRRFCDLQIIKIKKLRREYYVKNLYVCRSAYR